MNIKRATHIARHNLCIEVGLAKAVPKATHKWLDFWKIIVKALEKQKAKKPNIWGDGYADGHLVYDMWECPGCGKNYELEYDEHDYCPNCGQKIDWKREEDDTDETEKEDQPTE